MELALFVYIAGVIGQVSMFIGGVVAFALSSATVIVIVVAVSAPIWTSEVGEDTRKKIVASVKRVVLYICLPVALVGGCTQSVLPSEKTLYLMGGAYATQAVVQSETADKVLKIVNGKLDEYLVEMEKTVKEEVKK